MREGATTSGRVRRSTGGSVAIRGERGSYNLGDIVENSENLRPMLRNFILTEIVDSSPVGAVSSVVSESAQTIIDACEVLVKQLLDVYDWTHSRTDGRHGYELLRVTSTGALIVCRFSLDY